MDPMNHPLQKLVDTMNAVASNERSSYHLTLGELIDKLSPHEGKNLTVPFKDLDSYRGYYCDLSAEPGESPLDEFLDKARKAIGSTFTGYKGGDYVMTKNTPLWVAEYGCTGSALIDVKVEDGEVRIETKDVYDEA